MVRIAGVGFVASAGKEMFMRRRHLIEIHEQPWCPQAVRDGATDCLRLIAMVGRQFDEVLPLLRRALSMSGARRIIDLGSGGGGPWLALYPRLQFDDGTPIPITLTDLLPNLQSLRAAQAKAPTQIDFVDNPVDATAVPASMQGLRTLFTTFHHFEPPAAQAILQDAVNTGQAIAIFEQTRRTPAALMFMAILAPIALLGVPLIRPFRWSRLFWTYVLPVIPAVLVFDGVISCWRTYTEPELRAMIGSLTFDDGNTPDYVWELGHRRSLLSPLGISYLIGYPVRSDRAACGTNDGVG